MKKLREVYRLKFELGYSNRLIAQSIGISSSTVSEYVLLFKVSGLSWPEAATLDDEALERCTLRQPTTRRGERPTPDWQVIHNELQKKGVTLQLLWNEYKNQHPNGLGYTQFTKLYRAFANTLEPVMRFKHKAGEKTFVDYAGLTMEWTEPQTNEIHKAQIFVGCLGASNLTYADATASQTLPDWIASHVRMFEFFGGVSEVLVPDNLRSGVSKAHRYDPDLNMTYTSLAEHYNIAVIPTRIISPRDKAKVESAVQCIEREVIAPLRHRKFSSLAEIKQAIKEPLKQFNQRPMKRTGVSRQELFEQIEKSALKPLPLHQFEMQTWKSAKVHIDYHICVDKHFYSVPHRYIGKKVDGCMTKQRVNIFLNSEQIAIHRRHYTNGQFTTLDEHMPPQHKHYLEEENDASIERLQAWAHDLGATVETCVNKFFQTRAFPQQGIRAVLGLRRLAQRYGTEQFEAACQKVLELNRYRYRTIEAILKYELCSPPQSEPTTTKNKVCHEYSRGAEYFKGDEHVRAN